MIHLIMILLKISIFNKSTADYITTKNSLMNPENAKILRREQNGGTVAPMRIWTCDGVQLEMARYGHTVSDCVLRNGDIWFRIDTAMTWEESWQACHAIAGANLASVHNLGDFSTLRTLYWFGDWKNVGNWLGLNRILSESDTHDSPYRWSDGTALDYRKWIPFYGVPVQKYNTDNKCVHYSVLVAPVVVQINTSINSCIDGFVNDDCNRMKMPICKIAN